MEIQRKMREDNTLRFIQSPNNKLLYINNNKITDEPDNQLKVIKKMTRNFTLKRQKDYLPQHFFDSLLELEYLFTLDPDRQKYSEITDMLIVIFFISFNLNFSKYQNNKNKNNN